MSQENERDRKVQHKNKKATLSKIAYPDIMDLCEAKCSDYTYPVEILEVVNDRKDDKNI